MSVPIGIADPDHVVIARVARASTSMEEVRANLTFYQSALSEIRALPGVVSVGLSSEVPLGGINDTGMGICPVPRPAELPEEGIRASWRIVTGGYFQTMGIPTTAGRVFEEERDRPGSLIVLNEGLARRLWPDGRDPVGRTVKLSNGRTFTVAGIVGNVRQLDLGQEPDAAMYLPTSWFLWDSMVIVVRTAGDPLALSPAIREAVRHFDPSQAIYDVRTMRNVVVASTAEPRLNAAVLGAFAALALLLAAVGVAGVVSYTVARRTPELAVRLALGASPGQAVRLAMASGIRTGTVGVMVGVVVARGLSALVSAVLFGVRGDDPWTYAASVTALLGVGMIACWIPARRATRINPSRALQGE
jgi:putative ABC transport system permease protein